MSSRKDYEAKVRAKMAELEAEVERLQLHIKQTEEELLPEHHEKMDEIKELASKARGKLAELAEASDDSWEHLQEGLEHYWKSLGNELKAFEKI